MSFGKRWKHLLEIALIILSLSGCVSTEDHENATNVSSAVYPGSDKNSAHTAIKIQSKPDTASLIPFGWRESVISVSDLSEMTAFFTDVLAWEERTTGFVDRQTLQAWGLPAGASARYALMANPMSERGFVRIIDFDGVDQKRIRDHDQAWETGGIFNVNMRVLDIARVKEDITSHGWQAPSVPVNFQFGKFNVWEWIPRHKDGVRIAFIERVAPVLEGWPHLNVTSRTFNSTQIVKDLDRAIEFYQDVLGFETYLDHTGVSATAGENVLGLSREAMTSVVRRVRIVNPALSPNDGSIELLEFVGYSGRDFAEWAAPPNLGNLMIRFAVPDIDALHTYLDDQGVRVEFNPVTTKIAPYGAVKIFAVRAPDGAWLEFFEELP